jgi:uncharacterized linocin/CFP29 family protein
MKDAQIDFILNGLSTSPDIKDRLLACNMDPGVLRPYIAEDGRSYITVNRNGRPEAIRTNTQATLTKEAWLQLDTAILRAARNRLRIVADLRGAGLTYGVPNGMGTTVLEYQKMSDINDATISMDGLRMGADDRPVFESAFLPLPIIHKDFQFSLRQIQTSRQTGAPLDTTMGEMAGRKVAEYVEKLTLGRLSSYAYGGGTIYGMTNFPSRLTGTITAPTATAWTPATHLDEILVMKQTAQDAKHYGPFTLYYSSAWDRYLDGDFNTAYPNKTLRQRIREIDGIQDVRTLDYLDSTTSTYNVILLEMDSSTIREVIGMDVMTLEWDTHGGLLKNYKVMCIIIPQLRADIDGNTGIVHGSTA